MNTVTSAYKVLTLDSDDLEPRLHRFTSVATDQTSNIPLCLCRLNSAVFGGRLPADLRISWNVHLKTTAGLTHYSKTSLVGQAPR